jgi:hypothetical protein
LARRYADEHPLVLVLDIDVVRGLIGAWLDHWAESGLLARRMALAMARTHLAAGHDVLVPQFLGRVDFVTELDELCGRVGASFVELALLSDAADARRRFVQRSSQPETVEHRGAWALQERCGGEDALEAMYAALLSVVAQRPGTIVVPTIDGQPDQAYRAMSTLLDRR